MTPFRRCSVLVGLAVCLVLAACGGGSGSGGGSAPEVTLLTESVPLATTGLAYDTFFEASFAHPPGRFLRASGALPPGLTLDPLTGELFGFPRQVGTYRFEIEAQDGIDRSAPRDFTIAVDRKSFTLVVQRGLPNFLPPFTLNPAQYRAPYAHVFDVAGGRAPFQFSFAGGELPDGLTISSDGLLGSFPIEARQDPYVFQARVTDADNNSDVETFILDTVILPLIIGSPAVPEAAEDFAYTFAFSLASPGGGTPYNWTQVFPLLAGETNLDSIGLEITPQGVLRNKSGVPGPTTVGSFDFRVTVTDQANQQATPRAYELVVNPGPVLASITPNKQAAGGPFVVAGLNFQEGATLTFNPGQPTEQTITPTFDSPTQLRFTTAPTLAVSGFVPVRVTNPDAGFHVKPNAFAFPATTLDFDGTPRVPVPNSPLSSTGLAVADVNGDGFADIAHCGTDSFDWSFESGSAGGLDVLVNTPPESGFDPAAPAFERIEVATGDFHDVAFADVNGDGKPDLVAVGSFGGQAQVRAYLNGSSASTPAFTEGQTPVTSTLEYQGEYPNHVSDMALGQMTNGDSIPDLAYVFQDSVQLSYVVYSYYGSTWNTSYEEAGNTVSTVQGLGGGAFASTNLKTGTLIPRMFSAAGVSLGRFDGDALVDIHVSDDSNNHNSWAGWSTGNQAGLQGAFALTGSDGLFGDWTPISLGGYTDLTESLGTAAGDVNGDGNDDIVVTSGTDYDASESWGAPALTTFSGNGSGAFSSLGTISTSIRCRYNAIFDANFDLSGDVVVSGGTPGAFNKLDVYQGRPGSSGLLFKEQLTASVGAPNIGRVAAGDIDGDGKADVVACLSMFADSRAEWMMGNGAYRDRGDGSTMGIVFFLNASH